MEQVSNFNYLRQLISSGTLLRSWLRHYATSRKVGGSIPY
jgi:hypothetical protein